MQYRIRFSDQDFLFEETPTQQLVPASSEPSGPGIEQHFSFDETGSSAALVLYGPSEPSPVRSHHYRFLVQTIRILNDYRAGAVFLAGIHINHGFPGDVGYRLLLKQILGENACREIFFEFSLGTYGDRNLAGMATTWLYGGMPQDWNRACRKWYEAVSCFSTRVVGFSFRKHRFLCPAPQNDTLAVRAGDPVLLVREHDNPHDPNAIAILWQNGEKLGYIRRSIAACLAPVLDRGVLFTGVVAACLGHFRPDDERIHVRLERIQ